MDAVDPYCAPARPCRLCRGALTRARTVLGYTGCMECEQTHLFGQLAAALGRADQLPAWWIDPDVWEHVQNSQGVRDGLANPIPYGET